MLNSQATSAAIYKQLFTDEEWSTINLAMKDYADFYSGDKEIIAKSIYNKIQTIYKLTAQSSDET